MPSQVTFRDSFWRVSHERSDKIHVSTENKLSHVRMKLTSEKGEETIVMAEIISIFEDDSTHKYQLMCECYLLYSKSQFPEHLPWLNTERHFTKGFKARDELVICRHPCIMPLKSIVGRAKVADNIDKANTTRCAGETHFYRYEIDVYEQKVLALRTGVI